MGSLAIDYRSVNVGVNEVTRIHPNNSERCIRLFLKSKHIEKTRTEYKRDILQFFGIDKIKFLDGQDGIEYITDQMIRKVDSLTCEEYFNSLSEKYASTTVARKLNSVKALFNYIVNAGDIKGNDGLLLREFNPLNNVKVIVKKNEYGSFTLSEFKQLVKIAESEDKFEDALFYKILVKTSIRKEAARKLNIKATVPSDDATIFEKIDDIWCIHGFDKAKNGERYEFVRNIGSDLYDECVRVYNLNNDLTGKVFNFSENTALNRLRGYNKGGVNYYESGYASKIGISKEEWEDRHLCIHSFKKVGAQTVALESKGNVKSIMEQCGHTSPKYCMTTYMTAQYKPANDPNNLIDLDEILGDGDKVSDEVVRGMLREMSKEELVELIMGMDSVVKKDVKRGLGL